MKKNYISKIILLVVVLGIGIGSFTQAQVGVNNTLPEGLLDLGKNTTTGVIYPVTELADVNVETINNPNGGSLVAGTCVYNNNTTEAGINSVYPGIYIWIGTKWIPQFNKKDSKLFTQDINLRTGSDDSSNPVSGNQDISFDESIFTPKFSGPYKIVLITQYGAGKTNDPSGSQYTNFAASSGEFDFTFNSSTRSYKLKSYSGINDDRLFRGGSSALEYTNQIKQSTYIIEETLTKNLNYPFTLTFNQDLVDGFEANGDISISPARDGRGYIVSVGEFKCTVEMTYVGN